MAVPYINYSRAIGGAIGAVPMAMYKLNPRDTISPASMTGLVGMYTTNETWFAMFFQRFYFNEDNWRVSAAGGLGSVNYQFYLDFIGGIYIDYNTQVDFLYADVQRRIIGNLYGGVLFQLVNAKSDFDDLPFETDNTINGIGLLFALDERDEVYYPTSGTITNAKWTTFPSALGNNNVSNRIEFDHNQFFPMSDNDVLAYRLYSGFGVGELAFEQQFIVGRADIRGYTQGEFRGEGMAAAQTEYRWNFKNRFGLVGFAGIATLWDSVNEDHDWKLLPAGGGGIRFNVFPEYHMNVGIDAAVGVRDWGVYFKIGEAF